jgi:hypothetical protein
MFAVSLTLMIGIMRVIGIFIPSVVITIVVSGICLEYQTGIHAKKKAGKKQDCYIFFERFHKVIVKL